MAQRTIKQQLCKNHEERVGSFFLADQPWSKFCSECALNMALCGKKIDKDLSTQQLDNKTQVVSIIDRINAALREVEPNKKIIDEMVSKIERVADSDLGQAVKSFDQYVNRLCQIRDEVMNIFQTNFSQNIQGYFEKETKMLLAEIELKKSLQYVNRKIFQIQANYRNIIERKCPGSSNQNHQEWERLLLQIEQIFPTTKGLAQLEQRINENSALITNKLLSIEAFRPTLGQMVKKRTEHKITQGFATYESLTLLEQNKENPRKTQLKLRSKSRQSEKKSQRQGLKTRKSIRDISNFQIMESFHI